MLYTHSLKRAVRGLTRAWRSGFTGAGTLSSRVLTGQMRRNWASPCQGPQKSLYCPEMHRAGACGPWPRHVAVQFGDSLVSGQQAQGLASLQGLHLVTVSCFSFIFLFQLSIPRVL